MGTRDRLLLTPVSEWSDPDGPYWRSDCTDAWLR